MKTDFDIIVIGGGINGSGIARDASGRGYTVALLEMNDLSSATSSWSTKLIHGGLRYMEQYNFRLVRESLLEREILMEIAPNIIRPLSFVMPHSPGLRPSWLISLGLMIYDNIAPRKFLSSSRTFKLNKDTLGLPLQEKFKKGYVYSDCVVEDARLVVLNAMDANKNGAKIMTNTKVIKIINNEFSWKIIAENKDQRTKKTIELTSKVLVNASGPWVNDLASKINKTKDKHNNARLIKGSHIIVPRLYVHNKAYIFQNNDGRVIFTIPFEKDFSLIGTTDIPFEGNPLEAKISLEEINYLCESVSRYFKNRVFPNDVIWNYSGVRSLFDDGRENAKDITRDYSIKSNYLKHKMCISIFGGKITTYRKLSEEVMKIIGKYLNKHSPNWTSKSSLPGGEFSPLEFHDLLKKYIQKYSFLDEQVVSRLFQLYGRNIEKIIKNKNTIWDLGFHFGSGLYECEVIWLIENEWVKKAEDVLWRRTKLGLFINKDQVETLEKYINSKVLS